MTNALPTLAASGAGTIGGAMAHEGTDPTSKAGALAGALAGAGAYRAAGVDYEPLDAGKRAAVAQAIATSGMLARRGGSALDASRGSPAFVFELAGRHWALVVEGLGTKSIVAREVEEQLGRNRFGDVAYDTVAAILGDLACVGALPLVVCAYFATGASGWYARPERARALREGWAAACADAGCTWGGGESPALRDLVYEREIELAGSAVGALPEGVEPVLGERLRAGDEIVLAASTGIHANGVSLARAIAGRLRDGYATSLPGGRTLGDALLDPAPQYSRLVEAALQAGIVPTYISHITGHGLRKLMRSPKPLSYRVESLPPVPEVLSFLVERAGIDAREAYATFNMGAGFALCCRPGEGERIVAAAADVGMRAWVAGAVAPGEREVVLEPIGVRYGGVELALGG